MNYLTKRFYAEYRQTLNTIWLDCECGWMETELVDGSLECVGCGNTWTPQP